MGLKFGWTTAGDVASVLTLSISFLWSVHEVGREIQRFAKIAGTCNQALTMIKIPHEIVDVQDAQPLQVSTGKIEFENVYFDYKQNQSLFRGLSC